MDDDYIIAQRYRIGRKLGEGGMGTVYEAEHVVTGRRLAVKVLESRASVAPEEVDRFLREARAPAAIGHPNVVEIIDAGREPDGTAYIAMELLEGETLDDVIKRDRVVQPGTLAAVMDQLLAALDAMHARGFVHRDLKPANVFLARTQSSPMAVKLLDFGIAKAADQEKRTKSGYVMGTPAYMAPEQMRNARNATPRSDLWSAGVILYESLAGHRPFRGETFGLLAAIAGPAPHVPLGSVAPHLPRELCELVDLLLSKDLARRPGSAAGVRANLLPMLSRCPPVFPVAPPDDADGGARDEAPSDSGDGPRDHEPPPRLEVVSTDNSVDAPRDSVVSAVTPPARSHFVWVAALVALAAALGAAAVLWKGGDPPRRDPATPTRRANPDEPRTRPVAANADVSEFAHRWLSTVAGSQGTANLTPFYAERVAFHSASALTTVAEIQRHWRSEVFATGGSFGIDWDRTQIVEEAPDLNTVSAACINVPGATGRVLKIRAWATEVVAERRPEVNCPRLEGVYLIRLRRVAGGLRICHETWSMREGICASCPAAPACRGGGASRP